MGIAEFEEKEFEKPLYNQLEEGNCDVWSPGQCLEAYVGVDYGGNISAAEFWNRFGGRVPRGVVLNDFNMNYILEKIKKHKMFPDFSLNLFIQAKRPNVHSGQYRNSVYDTRHYSFEINQRQQRIMERLDHKLHHRALMVYAAPVFGTYAELYHHSRNKTIIANTSFPRVRDLSGHESWYYCDAESGVAHSEPEEQEVIDFYELIEGLRKEHYCSSNKNYSENLGGLSEEIKSVLKEFRDDCQVEYFFSELKKQEQIYELNHYRFAMGDYRTGTAFITIALFCEVFNLDWFVIA